MTLPIVAISGGFDPVHAGHIHLIQKAAEVAPVLVILNSDAWLARKKGCAFMPWEQRAVILQALRGVHSVVPVDDSDGTVNAALEQLQPSFFANSGDRTEANTPELDLCARLNIRPLFFPPDPDFADVHSSQLLAAAASIRPQTMKPWGQFTVLAQGDGYAVKELIVNPGESLSLQRHHRRSETWSVVEGEAMVRLGNGEFPLFAGMALRILSDQWHRLSNLKAVPVKVIEVQLGETDENDIERREDKYGRA